MNQYTRRSNIEINNISEKITQRNLEEYVSKVMKSLDINLVSYDLAYSLINQYSKRLVLTNETSKTALHLSAVIGIGRSPTRKLLLHSFFCCCVLLIFIVVYVLFTRKDFLHSFILPHVKTR